MLELAARTPAWQLLHPGNMFRIILMILKVQYLIDYITVKIYSDVIKCLIKNVHQMGLMVYFLIIFFLQLIDFTLYYLFYTPCFLSHGFSSDSMIMGAMIPIPKNRKQSLCDYINYRAIALSKKGMTITQYTYSMIETVNYYNFNKSNVFVLKLDASKTVDKS